MAEKIPEPNPGMEGEGNKTADKRYRDAASEHAQGGTVEAEAKEAELELDEHPEDFEAAIAEGKSRSAGDLPREEANPKP